MRPRRTGCCWTVEAQVNGLLVLCLIACCQIQAATGAPSCPPVGWSCNQDEVTETSYSSTLPGLEHLKVTYSEPSTPTSDAIVSISCGETNGSQIPDGILAIFSGMEPGAYFRLTKCQLAANQTVASVLSGHVVTKLGYTADHPLGDDLNMDIFRGLDQLQKLSLRNTGLTSIRDRQFASLPTLTDLTLAFNSLTKIPPEAFAGVNLTGLDISNNNLTELRQPWVGLGSVTNILLVANEIAEISREFMASAPNLEFLDLQNNKIRELAPDTFHDVPRLKVLNIYRNDIGTVPEELLASQAQLDNLNLSDNPRLVELPSGLIRNVTSLTQVNLQRCGLEEVPEDFFRSLTNLNTLLLGYNKIGQLLPGTFRDLQNLRTLDLTRNNLTTLVNDALSGLINLESLKLSSNRLTVLEPKAFLRLKMLRWLDMSANRLTNESLPNELFQQVQSLKTLNLSRNNLTYANSTAAKIELPISLETLILSYNQFTTLPYRWLVLGVRLIKMDLTYNRLTVFHQEDCQPASDYLLLDLRYNQIAHANLDIMLTDQIAQTARTDKTSRATVLLNDNPFSCDCLAENLLRYFYRQNSHAYPYIISIDKLYCDKPVNSELVLLKSLKMKDLECDVLEDCPDKCTCTRYVERRTVVNCTGSGRTELPRSAPYNTSTLRMTNTFLTSLSGIGDSRWMKLTALYLDNNDIHSLQNVTKFPASLSLLSLANNSFNALIKAELDMLDRYPKMVVDLRGNPWKCDCSARDFKNWLSDNVQRLKGPVSEVHCAESSERSLYLENLCPVPTSPRGLLVGVTVAGLLLAAGVAAAAIGYYRFRQEIKVWLYARGWFLWLVTEQEVDRDKTYDAFISFSQEDSEFVASHLLPGLEHGPSGDSDGSPSYRVCIHYRDWLAGEWIPDQIVRSVQESRRTIVVLSKNFIRSVWGRLEFKAAHHQALQDRTNRVVVVVLGDLPPASEMDPELKLYVKFNTYLKWGDPWFWQKLRYAMPHRPLSGSGPSYLPRPAPRQPRSTPSHIPASFLANTSPHQTPIKEQTKLPKMCAGNGNAIYNAIAEDTVELVHV